MLVGILCIGPSSLFQLPDEPWIVLMGLTLAGCGRGIINGFPTADAMKGGALAFPTKPTEVSDNVSAFATMSIGVNSLVTPNIGASLNSTVGFSVSMDFVLLLTFSTTIIFSISSILDIRR